MNSGKNNLLKMMAGTIAVAVLFAAVATLVSVYLPDGNESVPVGTPLLASDSKTFDASVDSVLDEENEAGIEADRSEEMDFIAEATETNVGGGLDFVSYEPVDDTELVLYRNQDTRSYVEWFYTQVTGSREIALAVLDAASQFNVSPSLAFALAYTESKYKIDANHKNVNGSIDRGLFQLNSYTFPNLTEEQFYDPATSAYYGMSHLNYCLEVSTSQVAGLAMYNAGRNKVSGDRTPQSTLNYISKILEYKEKLDGNFSNEILAFYSDGNGGSSGRYLAKY